MGFQLERDEVAEADGRVRFRYVIDKSAELVIARGWWEQLGQPDVIWATVRADLD